MLFENVLGDQRRGHRRRPAGIEGEVGDDFAELGLGEPVVERAFEMADELLFAAERDEGRDDNQAAVPLRKLRPFPNLAEQPLLGVADQVGHDIADRIARGRGLRLSHDFLRDFGWGG